MKIKSLFFVGLLSICFSSIKAQNWGGGIDDERLNFGFTFQYIASEYKILKKASWRTPFPDPDRSGQPATSNLKSISSPVSPGFGIGFVVNNSLTKNIDLRLTPTLVFNDRKMLYSYEVEEPISKTVKATMVDLPLGLKLKSDRLMNFRAYMLGGLKYSIDMASKNKTNDIEASVLEKNLKNQRNFLSYEAGIGFDLYFEWFKMSPEFKMSYSFKDIVKHEGNAFDTPIDKAKLRHFTFSLFFE